MTLESTNQCIGTVNPEIDRSVQKPTYYLIKGVSLANRYKMDYFTKDIGKQLFKRNSNSLCAKIILEKFEWQYTFQPLKILEENMKFQSY